MNELPNFMEQLGYRVESTLGEGGEAFVYRAIHPRIGLCAVKVTKQTFHSADDLPEQVRNSLNAAIALTNEPEVVSLHDWFVNGHLVTVWQLANSTLEKMINDRRSTGEGMLPRDTSCRLLMNVAKGLDRLHRRLQPVIHCDIKPANLLLFADDFLKIGDLGLAQLQTTLTAGEVAGRSTAYSLKRHEGIPTKARDVFGFAITYAELRLGQHPFGRETHEIIQNLEADRPQWNALDLDEQMLLRQAVRNEHSIDSLVDWLQQLLPRGQDHEHVPGREKISRQNLRDSGSHRRATLPADATPKDVNLKAKQLMETCQFADARELLESLAEHERDRQLYRTALDLSDKVRELQSRCRLAERNGNEALEKQCRQELQAIYSSCDGHFDNDNRGASRK